MNRSKGGIFMSALAKSFEPVVGPGRPGRCAPVTDFVSTVLLILSLLLLAQTESPAITKTEKHKGRAANHSLKRAEVKQAEARLAEMGYGTGPVDGVIDGVTRNALIAFQKWSGREVTGRLSREAFEAIMSSGAPQSKDPGYRHVEVDLDRQVLLLTDSNGMVERVLPVSTGSDRHYNEKGMSGLAYTPRGRFRIYAKIAGWRESPLGLLYYPNYFSDGLAIHGNPSVPQSPQSHGCIRIPLLAAAEISRLLPVGTIVLIYDQRSFVSAKDWAEADRQKQEANSR
jgi:peptidoglycan hydrolase-like protein with peptidoglycan-binding domain